GLDLAGQRPTRAEVAAAAGRVLAAGTGARLAEQVLHRFLIWTGIDLGLPVQLHVGYGDRDVDLHRCDPLLLTDLLRATEPAGVPVLLLHNYPYHRQAGYLAQVFGHVFVDTGLATHNVGDRATALLAEALELAPFGKFLYSSDAFALPELYHLGAVLFRGALSGVLRAGIEDGWWTAADAPHVAELVGSANAERVYRLPR
ncbi:MAG TPA: amidohydrolase family protein, partial [Rugosimonospora sp.]|nr:amidohydrolase family protein [Rugosimonospora sp.]